MANDKIPLVSSKVGNPLPDLIPHAVKANGLIFVSGTIGFDKNCKLVDGGVRERTHQCIKNIRHVLEDAGSSLPKVVKINIYLATMDDFAEMNAAYGEYFVQPNLPSRTCVAVKTLPSGADVEMECTALA